MKKMVFCLGILALVSMLMPTAYAYYQHSGYKNSAEIVTGKTYTTSTYNLYTTSAPVIAKNVGVTFYYFGNLREGVSVANNNRKLHGTLYEDDALNSDDTVKYYLGSFSGLYLSGVVIDGYANSETTAIEADSDDRAELYLKYSVDKISGDTSSSNGTLFSYDFRTS